MQASYSGENETQASSSSSQQVSMQNSSSSSQQVSMQKSESFVSHQSQSIQQSTSAKNFIVNESENIVKRRKNKKSQNKIEDMNMKNTEKSVTNGSHKYDRNSLRELDAQIMDIQTQFESELEGLIGLCYIL